MQKTKADKPLKSDAPCGCGSGLKYAGCCQVKGIRYFVSRKGTIVRRIPIHPKLKEAIGEGEKRFREIFGRKMGRGDILLFDHFLNGEEDRWQVIRRIGQEAEIREELIFAWRRSGFIVAEETRRMMPDIDYQEWENAIDEYLEIKKSGFDPFYVFTYLEPLEYEHYKKCVELIDHVIIIGFNSVRKIQKFKRRDHYFKYMMICSALNSMRTINEMYASRYDDDCLAVLRGIYEQYLRIKLLRLNPERLDAFDAAVHALVGIWPNKIRKNGTVDFATVIDPKSGKEIKITISNHFIASLSDFEHELEVYQGLYNQLSGHVHHDVSAWALKGFVTEELSLDRDQDHVRAIAFVLFVSVLLFSEMLNLRWITKHSKRDIRYNLKSLCSHVHELANFRSVREFAHLPNCLATVCETIADNL